MSSPPSTSAASPVDVVAEQYARERIGLNPELATMLGVPGNESAYSDYSPEGLAALADLNRRTLSQVEALPATSGADRVTVAAMRERLSLELEEHESGWDQATVNNIASPVQEIRQIFDLMPRRDARDWGHIAERLHQLPLALRGYRTSLEAAADQGKVAAVRQVGVAAGQAQQYAADGGFFDQLLRQSGQEPLSPAQQDRLQRGVALARDAYRECARFLCHTLARRAPEADAVGWERYSRSVRYFLGSEIDLQEAYEWGAAELEAIIAEQEAVAAKIEPGASILQAKAVLDADPARQLHGTGALQEWMQGLSDAAIVALSGTQFDIPAAGRQLECCIAPTQEGGIYYTPPSDDFSRPGRMWWSVPAGEEQFTTWSQTSTVYHEGVPGHHLQHVVALAHGNLNLWRRSLCWVSGHGEGWALYAERLMQELGYLEDPGDAMGMLDAQHMRAARVVFDIGVHLGLAVPKRWGTGTWDAEKGYEFLRANVGLPQGQLDFEFVRYLGWPGQAPSYKVGQRIWEQLRQARSSREGNAFDIRTFHSRALALGSLPLDVLTAALLEDDTQPAQPEGDTPS